MSECSEHSWGAWSQYRRCIVEWRHVGASSSRCSSILHSKSKRQALTATLITSHAGPSTVHFTPIQRLPACALCMRETTPANEVVARSRERIRVACCVVVHVACVPNGHTFINYLQVLLLSMTATRGEKRKYIRENIVTLSDLCIANQSLCRDVLQSLSLQRDNTLTQSTLYQQRDLSKGQCANLTFSGYNRYI